MTLSVVCHRFRLAVLCIAKNATSTLRRELTKDRFGGVESYYRRLPEDVRDQYLTVAFLRHPVDRFLSAYQEISMRIDGHHTTVTVDHPFASMPAGRGRFEAFLGQAEERLWDRHIRRQVDYMDGIRVDLYGRVESLQQDLAAVYERLGMGPLDQLPRRRSREGRAEIYGYDRHWLRPRDLDPGHLARIESLYADDFALWRRVTDGRGRTRWSRPEVRRSPPVTR